MAKEKEPNILKNNIDVLNLSSKVYKKLKDVDIVSLKDLWNVNRTFLKNNNFSNSEITEIKVKLQLIGLDINKKVY